MKFSANQLKVRLKLYTSHPKTWLTTLFLAAILFSCEDVIDIQLDDGVPQLVVDAWITDQSEQQEVTLSISGPYLGEGDLPIVTDASVTLSDEEGNAQVFLDPDNDGIYTWSPITEGQALVELGGSYTLTVSYEGETYRASSSVMPVAPIDSLTFEYREESFNDPEGYFALLWARDLEGAGNRYWIRTYKNGEFLNRPQDINLAYDAAFNQGGNNDGLPFIVPIREGINPDIEDEDGTEISPYMPGDTVRVEIYSLTGAAFDFLSLMRDQLTATGGLFAVPLPNLPSSFESTDPSSDKKPLGFFGTSAVSSEKVIIKEIEEDALAEGQ